MAKMIVLTGGPCAGKTMALKRIVEHFTAKGYKVFSIPEMPTIFIAAGMDYLTSNKDFFYEGEKATMKAQLLLEDSFMDMADTLEGQSSIVICDRGAIDISTYMPENLWERLGEELGFTQQSLLGRYDAVIHLTTSAKGMEQFYNTVTNAQRLEQADDEGMKVARMLDDKALRAWKEHPCHYVIPNNTDFDAKLQQVVDVVEKIVPSIERECK